MISTPRTLQPVDSALPHYIRSPLGTRVAQPDHFLVHTFPQTWEMGAGGDAVHAAASYRSNPPRYVDGAREGLRELGKLSDQKAFDYVKALGVGWLPRHPQGITRVLDAMAKVLE